MCWRLLECENVFPLVNLTFKWSNTRQFSPHLLLFKASAVRHGPQQPTGSEPCSFSTRLQQFWGGDGPRTPSDTSYARQATLFIQLCWSLWPSALGRSAAQNPAPQYWFLHGMKKRTLYVCLCWISSFWLVVHCYLCQIKLPVFTRWIFRCTLFVSDGLPHILSVFIQERAFGELEKNSDKQLSSDSQGQTDPPSHFHQLLSGLHKHLLAHCYIHSGPEVHCSIGYMWFYPQLCGRVAIVLRLSGYDNCLKISRYTVSHSYYYF